jgi:signal transduction histidine kinase/ActR/RegA family two-component response regulator
MPQDCNLSREALLQALEVIGDGIAIYDGAETPIMLNCTTRERFGSVYDDMEREGISYLDAVRRMVRRLVPNGSEDEIEALAQKYHRYFSSGESYVTVADNGQWVRVTFRKMPNGMTAAISVDITHERERAQELRRAREAADAANIAKSAFLANMSHEIRTPLNGIIGMAQVMMGTELTDQQREFMTVLIESGQTLTNLLNDVLDLSKIEAGKLAIAPTDTDVHALLKRIATLWRSRAEEKGLAVSLLFDADLPRMIRIDALRLQQCVSNLISNAIKFTQSGEVRISARARKANGEPELVIDVSDTGAGMDEATLNRLFTPFVQADDTIARKHGGTGLGLSIVRKLAEAMGGQATVVSELGKGSTFTLSFQYGSVDTSAIRTRETDRVLGVADRSALRASNLRILVVDDQPINRRVVELFLKAIDATVVHACNGEEALDVLAAETFDLVLLDMHMPVMDGPAAIREIRASPHPWSRVPVIALTADAMSGDRERYLAMGMDGYLSKPLCERELISEVARVTGLAGVSVAA